MKSPFFHDEIREFPRFFLGPELRTKVLVAPLMWPQVWPRPSFTAWPSLESTRGGAFLGGANPWKTVENPLKTMDNPWKSVENPWETVEHG